MEGEPADDPVEDHDRRREDGPAPEVHEHVPPPERGVVEVGRRRDVLEGDRPTPAKRQVRDGKARGIDVHGFDAGRRPLRQHGHLLPLLAESHERTGDAERTAGLAHRDVQHVVEVELGANLAADLGDEALALEDAAERVGRAETLDHGRRDVAQPTDRVELRRREEAALGRRGQDENGDDAVLEDERHEADALRADG